MIGVAYGGRKGGMEQSSRHLLGFKGQGAKLRNRRTFLAVKRGQVAKQLISAGSQDGGRQGWGGGGGSPRLQQRPQAPFGVYEEAAREEGGQVLL